MAHTLVNLREITTQPGLTALLDIVYEIIEERITLLKTHREKVTQLVKDARKIGNLVVLENDNNERDEDLRSEYLCSALILEGEITRIEARIAELRRLIVKGELH